VRRCGWGSEPAGPDGETGFTFASGLATVGDEDSAAEPADGVNPIIF